MTKSQLWNDEEGLFWKTKGKGSNLNSSATSLSSELNSGGSICKGWAPYSSKCYKKTHYTHIPTNSHTKNLHDQIINLTLDTVEQVSIRKVSRDRQHCGLQVCQSMSELIICTHQLQVWHNLTPNNLTFGKLDCIYWTLYKDTEELVTYNHYLDCSNSAINLVCFMVLLYYFYVCLISHETLRSTPKNVNYVR